MFAKLTGVIDTLYDDWLILDVQGVGYRVSASSKTLGAIGKPGTPLSLFIETQVREDAITLFGFRDADEQAVFKLLTSVQGVGAKVALAIQSVLTAEQLKLALSSADKAAISQANGVGPKLAQRIISELKDKAVNLSIGGLAGIAPSDVADAGSGAGKVQSGSAGLLDDVTSALVNLGYRPMDAQGAAARAIQALGDDASIGQLVPKALKELG